MNSVRLGAREVPVDLRAWDAELRRGASLAVIGVASALVILGAVLRLALPGVSLALTLLLVVMALVLLFQGAVVATGVLQERDTTAAPAAGGHEVLTLQCSECATQFDITDTGERPLYHACPGCGAEGVLGEEASDAYAEAAAHATHVEPPAEEAVQEPLRKLKLRCPGCSTVFVVEDFGERPLRTECPGCSRQGELR